MQTKHIIGLGFALWALPLLAHAELPGQPCQKEQIGTTKMADNKQNIIACLETGNTQQGANIYEWKAMTSSGGGVTGGCFLIKFYQGTTKNPGGAATVLDRWGQGCKPDDYPGHIISLNGPAGAQVCGNAAASGYSCGMTFTDESPSIACTCVKK